VVLSEELCILSSCFFHPNEQENSVSGCWATVFTGRVHWRRSARAVFTGTQASLDHP